MNSRYAQGSSSKSWRCWPTVAGWARRKSPRTSRWVGSWLATISGSWSDAVNWNRGSGAVSGATTW